MFCASMFVLLCCFFWPLYYLTFYDLHGFCLPLWYLRITILLVSSEYSVGILWYPFGIFWVLLRYSLIPLRYPRIPLWYLQSFLTYLYFRRTISNILPIRLFDWNKQKHIKERFVVFFFAHLYNWFWFVVFLC